jgi:hypothetical protein
MGEESPSLQPANFAEPSPASFSRRVLRAVFRYPLKGIARGHPDSETVIANLIRRLHDKKRTLHNTVILNSVQDPRDFLLWMLTR